MKRNLFFMALSAMALVTSCSNDEVTEVSDSNAIKFATTVGKNTRAVTTTSTISNFKVWAFTDSKTYMDGITVTKTNDGVWTYDGTKFWPETAVDFFSLNPITPQSGTVSVTNAAKTISNYTADGTEDLIYASNIAETKRTAPVSINFRHALSQIVFKVKNTNEELSVKVEEVKVDGVKTTGTLTWATATTGPNLTTDTGADTETGSTWGTWVVADDKNEYTANITVANNVTSETQMLTNGDGLLLMPQTLVEWNKLGGQNSNNGARILVKCTLKDAKSDIQLWPKTGENAQQYVAIPFSEITWKQGKKYVYTLIFGEGGGYNPDPDDPTPDPVLVPIKFEVTVDEFQKVDPEEINTDMKTTDDNQA